MLERYGVVLREAAGAEGLPGGFGYVYDVYKAMEEQGRLRRGYFVAGRGAMQFALPGAEERLRTKPAADEEPKVLVLAATDPANPYGTLIPWPDAEGRSPQRTPGARVILSDGELMGWLARGAHHLVTFLPKDEGEAALRMTELAKALVRVAGRQGRSLVIATIDGVPAPESRCARVLVENGFLPRQGALVKLAGEGTSLRLGARRRPELTPDGFNQDDMWPGNEGTDEEDVDDEMDRDLEELDELTSSR
jgi:ATP-dependent Lhr-like helicase